MVWGEPSGCGDSVCGPRAGPWRPGGGTRYLSSRAATAVRNWSKGLEECVQNWLNNHANRVPFRGEELRGDFATVDVVQADHGIMGNVEAGAWGHDHGLEGGGASLSGSNSSPMICVAGVRRTSCGRGGSGGGAQFSFFSPPGAGRG